MVRMDQQMYSKPEFSMYINGRRRPRGHIQALREIRQGYPLSPFLFLIISEVFGALINRAHESGVYEGFLVGQDKVHLSILR